YISSDGQVQIPAHFEAAYAFKEERGRVRVDHHWGFIDRQGELVVPAVFFEAHDFSEGMARVVPVQRLASDNLVARAVGDTVGNPINRVPIEYVDLKGTLLIEPEGMTEGGDFHDGVANVGPF